GGPGDNDVAEVTDALKAITYSNSQGIAADTEDRSINIVLNDGETDSAVVTTTVDITVAADPIVDLNSTPATSFSSAVTGTTELVSNGNLSSVSGGVPSGWSEVGNAGAGAASNGRYLWTGNSSGTDATLVQALTLPAESSATTYDVVAGTLTETTT